MSGPSICGVSLVRMPKLRGVWQPGTEKSAGRLVYSMTCVVLDIDQRCREPSCM